MKIGFCSGCFDLFHDGHYHFLARAKEHCDYLVVALCSDLQVRSIKGSARPVDEWPKRMDNVMQTGLVDAVIPLHGSEFFLIGPLVPDVWIRGYDQFTKGSDRNLHLPDGAVVRIEELPGHSTSLQIERRRAITNG